MRRTSGVRRTLYQLGRVMPRKTRQGAEAAAKWRAFRRYLANLQRFDDLAAAKERWAEYLPYAIAMGLEQRFLNALPALGVQETPSWYVWHDEPGGGRSGRTSPSSSETRTGGLQSMSRGGGRQHSAHEYRTCQHDSDHFLHFRQPAVQFRQRWLVWRRWRRRRGWWRRQRRFRLSQPETQRGEVERCGGHGT